MKSIIYMIIAVFLMVGVAVAGNDEKVSPEEWESIKPIMEDIYKICGEDKECFEEQVASAIGLSRGIKDAQELPDDQSKYMILGVFDLCAMLTMDDEFSMNFSEMRICVNQSLDELDKELDRLLIEAKKQSGV